MSFTSISKVIAKKFGRSPLAKSVTAALVCDEFNRLILEKWGEKIKDTARAMYVKDKILTVACLSPVVAQEIKMKEGELLEKIKEKFGEGIVERLRLLT
jgi:predicted nucleic acid-binding Zn ribbon protein